MCGCVSLPASQVEEGVPGGGSGRARLRFFSSSMASTGTSCHQVGMMSRAGGQLLRLDRVKIFPDREKGCGLAAGKHQIML